MMAQSLPFNLISNNQPRSNSLFTWLVIAIIFHFVILLGIKIVDPESEKISKAIEITLVSSATRKAPENADYLAQENQIGAGLEQQKPMPNQQKIPYAGKDALKKVKNKEQKKKKILAHRVITQKNKAIEKTAEVKKTVKIKEVVAEEKVQKETELSLEALNKQIAQLGERIQYLKQSSEKNNIKFVNSISAHKYVAAQYVRDWEKKIERIGNLNYPEMAREEGFSGILSMDVGIKANGSIYNIRIVKSSGNQALDDAAEQIVQMSAPFARLPNQILNQLDVLVIRRVWHFTNESKLSF